MCWVYNTRFPFPQADDDSGCCQERQQKENTVKTWVRGPRRHSRQQGLLPESNGPLSGCPRGRPSLGRWRLNVQPKHDTHTHTHTKIKKNTTNQPPTTRNLETKTPTSILKVKALSPGQRPTARWGRTLPHERKLLPSHFSPPVLSSQKMVWNISSTPKKKESDSAKPFPKGSPKQKKQNKTLVAAGPGSKKGRNLHIKMYLKSKSKKIVLRFNTPVSSLFYTATPQKWGHLEGAALTLTWRALNAPTAGLSSPISSFLFWKSTILSSCPRAGWFWFVSLEPSIKEATFSCYFDSGLSIRAAIPFYSSVAHRLTWPNGLINACIRTAYCYQNGMWEYAMHLRLRNDQEIRI